MVPSRGAMVEWYYSLGIPIDKTNMHDGHPRCVAQVGNTQFYIIVCNALVEAQNLKSGPSFELQNECGVTE